MLMLSTENFKKGWLVAGTAKTSVIQIDQLYLQ
jgi:hypothetical protein